MISQPLFARGDRGLTCEQLGSHAFAAGETQTVTPLEDAPAQSETSNVVDLTELLANSLAKRKPAESAGSRGKKPAARPARRKPG